VADKKLTELDQVRAPAPEALLYVVQGGVDHRIERQHLLALPGYVDGLGLEYVDDHTITVSPGRATAAAGDFLLGLDAPVTVDLTANGAGGLDSGAEAPDTWYAVHVIGDTSGGNSASAVFSTSADSPTLPPGYDRFRRVGWVRNDASGNLRKFLVRGAGRDRLCWWDGNQEDLAILSAGKATTWTVLDAGAFVPPSARDAELVVWFRRGTSPSEVKGVLRPAGASAENFPAQARNTGENMPVPHHVRMPLSARQLEYRLVNSNGTAELWIMVRGWHDEL
jgi:hypothetical protein